MVSQERLFTPLSCLVENTRELSTLQNNELTEDGLVYKYILFQRELVTSEIWYNNFRPLTCGVHQQINQAKQGPVPAGTWRWVTDFENKVIIDQLSISFNSTQLSKEW